MKSHLLVSFNQSLSVLFFSHQPLLNAGPTAHGSVANLNPSPSIVKKAWLKYVIEVFIFLSVLSFLIIGFNSSKKKLNYYFVF